MFWGPHPRNYRSLGTLSGRAVLQRHQGICRGLDLAYGLISGSISWANKVWDSSRGRSSGGTSLVTGFASLSGAVRSKEWL